MKSRGRKSAANHGASVRPSLRAKLGTLLYHHHQTSFLRSITSATEHYISRSESPASTQTPTNDPHNSTIMPRQSRGPASAPKRPSVPTPQSRSAPQHPAQARQASTVAQPPANQHAPPPAAPQQAAPAASGGSGLFGQMASTAA